MRVIRMRPVPMAVLSASVLSACTVQRPAANWVGTWAASPMACPLEAGEPSAGDSTYRNVMRISIGGRGLRVRLTNEFGSTPLKVGSAHVAMDAGNGTVKPGTDRELTFGGRRAVAVPANAMVLSDEVSMAVPPLASLTVSLHVVDQELPIRSCHLLGSSTNYVTKADATAASPMPNARTTDAWHFVKGIDVRADEAAFAVVTLGDSITDGNSSTKDANHRWPDYLAERLQKSRNTAQVAVLNAGMIGNRVLHNELGPNAIARFDRDVLAQSGARYLVLLQGINDINWLEPSENVSAEELIVGVSQLIERARTHGLKVLVGTLTPYGGADGFSEKGERARTGLNSWYRTAGVADGVIDFDKATRDPSRPTALKPGYDSGDHLHPSDAGYEAMANVVDLSVFR